MSDAYDVVVADDGRVVVLIHPNLTIDREKVVALLVECGTDPSNISFVDPAELEHVDDLNGVPIIVPIDKSMCDEPGIEDGARHCAQSGGSVIVVFCEGFEFEGLHPIAADYGTQCGWSPDQLAPRLKPQADCPPLQPSGEPVGRSSARPVKCGT